MGLIGILILLAGLYFLLGIRITNQYERAVVFRLGRFDRSAGPRDCLGGQESAEYGVLALTRALAVTMSLRAMAMRATLPGLPLSRMAL